MSVAAGPLDHGERPADACGRALREAVVQRAGRPSTAASGWVPAHGQPCACAAGGPRRCKPGRRRCRRLPRDRAAGVQRVRQEGRPQAGCSRRPPTNAKQAAKVENQSWVNPKNDRAGWGRDNDITEDRLREFLRTYEKKKIRGHHSKDKATGRTRRRARTAGVQELAHGELRLELTRRPVGASGELRPPWGT
jgi:hypothetical protein